MKTLTLNTNPSVRFYGYDRITSDHWRRAFLRLVIARYTLRDIPSFGAYLVES
jgi:hypothetical protein